MYTWTYFYKIVSWIILFAYITIALYITVINLIYYIFFDNIKFFWVLSLKMET